MNTLANSWLEWDAARHVIGQRVPWFVHIPCATYLRDIHTATTPTSPEPLRDDPAADWTRWPMRHRPELP